MHPRLALAALLLLTACTSSAPAAPPTPIHGRGGEVLADFALPDLAGATVPRAELRGKVVLLTVWATWCEPCREELPELQALHRRHQDAGLMVVGVSIDARRVEPEVRRLTAELGITYPVLLDPASSIVPPLKIVGYPTTFLIGRDGAIQWRRDGLIEPGDFELSVAITNALSG